MLLHTKNIAYFTLHIDLLQQQQKKSLLHKNTVYVHCLKSASLYNYQH